MGEPRANRVFDRHGEGRVVRASEAPEDVAPWRRRPFLSVGEAAALFGVSRATLYRSISRGDFPIAVLTINGRLRILSAAAERLLDGDQWRAPAEANHRPASSTAAEPSEAAVAAPPSDARRRPMCSAARRSSSPITSV